MTRARLAERCTAAGSLGAVAAGAGTAATIGAAALLRGGNAFDAALAAALAETVLLPSKCGLAGDLVALVLPAASREPRALLAIGPAARDLPTYAEAHDWRVAPTGGTSVGVPGAPAGYSALAGYTRLPLADLAAPAIAMARRGIVWSRFNDRLVAEAKELLRTHQPDGSRYSAFRTGDLVRLPGLGMALEEFVRRRERLFEGPLGDACCAYVAEHGGVLSKEDFGTAVGELVPAEETTVGRNRAWATPEPTYGPALLDSLTDPTPHGVRKALARLREAPALAEGTSAVAAADTEGNAIVIVHSNSYPRYGSGLVVPGYDLVLNNRAGRGFVWEQGHPHAPAPGRRPLTTLHAWAFGHDRPTTMGATPGGEQQVPWNAQLLASLLDGRDAGEALTDPRWELAAGGNVRIEGRELDELGARSSHVVVRVGATAQATADPRLEGLAVAA